MTQSPLVLAIAGDDPSGQAGLARDQEVLEALGCRFAGIRTARTAQDPARPQQVWAEDPEVVKASLQRHLAAGPVAAVKLGMLANEGVVNRVVSGLESFGGPVVLDPVLESTSGLCLLKESAYPALLRLAARCTLVTPNLPELERLGGMEAWHNSETATLIKGGHDEGDWVVDRLVLSHGEEYSFRHPRRLDRAPRGTGCALSSAIAGFLAHGASLENAVSQGIQWLQERFFS